jgi:hypothetical protein
MVILMDVPSERAEETPEAKARWFQSLSMQERMDLLCEYTDLIFAVNPHIADAKNAEQTGSHIRILTCPGR